MAVWVLTVVIYVQGIASRPEYIGPFDFAECEKANAQWHASAERLTEREAKHGVMLQYMHKCRKADSVEAGRLIVPPLAISNRKTLVLR